MGSTTFILMKSCWSLNIWFNQGVYGLIFSTIYVNILLELIFLYFKWKYPKGFSELINEDYIFFFEEEYDIRHKDNPIGYFQITY
jgi:hypothetical protein